MDLMITPLRPDDTGRLAEALALVRAVFTAFDAPDYGARGIAEFMAYVEDGAFTHRMHKHGLLAWAAHPAGEENTPVAGVLAGMPGGHLSLLFVAPAFQRQGVATELLRTYTTACRAAGATRQDVHSAPGAVAVYRRLGFAETGPERTENGIRYLPMAREV